MFKNTMWFCLEDSAFLNKTVILMVIFVSDEKNALVDRIDFPVKVCISYSKYVSLTLKIFYTTIMLINMRESLKKEI